MLLSAQHTLRVAVRRMRKTNELHVPSVGLKLNVIQLTMRDPKRSPEMTVKVHDPIIQEQDVVARPKAKRVKLDGGGGGLSVTFDVPQGTRMLSHQDLRSPEVSAVRQFSQWPHTHGKLMAHSQMQSNLHTTVLPAMARRLWETVTALVVTGVLGDLFGGWNHDAITMLVESIMTEHAPRELVPHLRWKHQGGFRMMPAVLYGNPVKETMQVALTPDGLAGGEHRCKTMEEQVNVLHELGVLGTQIDILR